MHEEHLEMWPECADRSPQDPHHDLTHSTSPSLHANPAASHATDSSLQEHQTDIEECQILLGVHDVASGRSPRPLNIIRYIKYLSPPYQEDYLLGQTKFTS